jgi:DNA-binding CsgD family transcriptional regulator
MQALTPTGIDILGKISWGTHLGVFYETKQDFLEIVIPYFRAGLENKEFCLWILPPSMAQREALEALKRGVPDLDRHLSERNFELASDYEWYMPGGTFEFAGVLERFNKKIKETISRGYVGLRVNGSAASLQNDSKRFNEYEKELDDHITNERAIILCSYPLEESGSSAILDAARTHQFTAALRDGSWEVVEAHQVRGENLLEHEREPADATSSRFAKLAELTPREHAVLAQIAAGASSKEAARVLGISPRTVEFHRANILHKLSAKNTVDLMRIVHAA